MAGQAQKELTHNEALQMVDALIAPAVEGAAQAIPPAAPVAGNCYLVGAAATGAWAGQTGKLAQFTSGGWRFIAPVEGMTAFVRSNSQTAVYRQGAWELGQIRGTALILGGQQVVAGRGAAIASPSGGATVDSQARGAVDLILAALRQHGLIET
ncbi:MAG: DUF2793 domain-containing protein [Sphingomicrobium sp.]